jgi:hypothetical protein
MLNVKPDAGVSNFSLILQEIFGPKLVVALVLFLYVPWVPALVALGVLAFDILWDIKRAVHLRDAHQKLEVQERNMSAY